MKLALKQLEYIKKMASIKSNNYGMVRFAFFSVKFFNLFVLLSIFMLIVFNINF